MKRRVLLAGLISIVLCACNPPVASPTPGPTFMPTVRPGNTSVPTLRPTGTPVELSLRVTDELVNCRFGPGILYGLVNEYSQGQSARVLGRNDTSTWWYIRDPGNPNGFCWISADVTEVKGDVDALPVVHPAAATVTEMVLIVEPKRMVVACTQFPQTFFFEAQITTNGPVLVHWQWEASTGVSSDIGTLIFDEAGTKAINEFYQVGSPNDYWVKLHILSPNVLTEQAAFRVSCSV
jgi:hypothetical protein